MEGLAWDAGSEPRMLEDVSRGERFAEDRVPVDDGDGPVEMARRWRPSPEWDVPYVL
jgi:hypothetical protein